MNAVIHPSTLKGVIPAPASKSMMQRACALALLHAGETIITNPGNSQDDLAAISVIQQLGATVSTQHGQLIIRSTGMIQSSGSVDCGESGLSFRMFSAIAALSDEETMINGQGSLLTRPMHFIEEVFPLLGIQCKLNKGHLPATVRGPLIPADIRVDGSQSSQYLTGLLFAMSAAAKKPVTVTVTNLVSKPYIDLSMVMLVHFGYDVHQKDHQIFTINPVKHRSGTIQVNIEGDWSNAAFLLVAGVLAGPITVSGLDIHSTQADKAILNVLQDCGAIVSNRDGSLNVVCPQPLKSFRFDATHCPDLFPPLVALAAHCNGRSVIKGISRLAGKESNRAETLKEVFECMGISIHLAEDDMQITGGMIQAAKVSSHHDHRIAMAAAVSALRANGPVEITHAEAVHKSYPTFYSDIQMLGAAVSLFN
jgi:3-phosphoshikimate 1-carboxyvinyltransferase